MRDYNYYAALNRVLRTLSGKDDRPKFNSAGPQTEQENDFEAFLMVLNAANRTPEKAQRHYDAFLKEGFAYFDANPQILAAVPRKRNASIEEAKARLADTMARRHHSADRVGGVLDEPADRNVVVGSYGSTTTEEDEFADQEEEAIDLTGQKAKLKKILSGSE
jgi:hypothetical protein